MVAVSAVMFAVGCVMANVVPSLVASSGWLVSSLISVVSFVRMLILLEASLLMPSTSALVTVVL